MRDIAVLLKDRSMFGEQKQSVVRPVKAPVSERIKKVNKKVMDDPKLGPPFLAGPLALTCRSLVVMSCGEVPTDE